MPEPKNVHLTLTTVSGVADILLLCVFVSIPRRPSVFRDEKIVDEQYTVNLISRLTFSWTNPLLATAKKNKTLEQQDLPKVGFNTRSKNLRAHFEKVQGTNKLWQKIVRANWYGLTIQLILCCIVAVVSFAPQVTLLQVLRALEKRDQGYDSSFQAWTWVIALGLAMLFSGWIESWLHWTSFSKVGIPIFEQISAVVFGKSMRRKDVKSTGKKKDPSAETNGDLLVNKGSGVKGEDTVPKEGDEEEEEEEEAKTRQSTINLIGVDGKRVSDFSIFSHIFPGSAIRLVVAFSFLTDLIGWIPLVCGLLYEIRQGSRRSHESEGSENGVGHRGSTGYSTDQVLGLRATVAPTRHGHANEGTQHSVARLSFRYNADRYLDLEPDSTFSGFSRDIFPYTSRTLRIGCLYNSFHI